ncbi:MAG: hypothetical protein HYV32_02380 [Candidatus Kerfeldbacteria bacterium]|nr:hypothetical protein [Candidatus Kerfeldbacteria bacterium]
MNHHAMQSKDVTLENWQFALAPLSEEEQRKIHVALLGVHTLAQHVRTDSSVGELDFVAGCMADLICNDINTKVQIRKLLNHALARALQEGAEKK